MKMARFIIVITSAFAVVSCSAIQAKKLANDIENYASVVEQVCDAVELFEAIGKPFPGSDACVKILKTTDAVQTYGDALAVNDVLNCIQNHDAKSPEFAECITSVKWWPIIVDRITREAQKMVD